MSGRDYNFQVVFKHAPLPYFCSGGIVMFQLSSKHNDDFWLGRTFPNYFELECTIHLSYEEAFFSAMTLTEPKPKQQMSEPDDQLKLF